MEEKLSVVIPNFNGKELLAKNLPQVLTACPGCQVIVVDDASQDDSVQFLKKNFPTVETIVNKKNQGFAKTANEGVKRASGKLVLLLNSDVSPRKGFLKPALLYFSDKSVFAVGLHDLSHEGSRIISKGRGGLKFEKGFFVHFPLQIKKGTTFWVSGGSGIFDRQKFLDLNGFDQFYKPFYWEDLDLSFRAWKAGFKCFFEPLSKVDHFHEEGAILNQKSKFFIRTVSYKNQFIFVWKNTSGYFLALQHLLWLPYHFIKALASQDLSFFVGFAWAATKLPFLVLNLTADSTIFKLTDSEVITSYEKP